MFPRKRIGLTVFLAIPVMVLASFLTAGAAPADQSAGVSVSMTGAIEPGGGVVDYSVTVTNNTGSAISGLYVTGSIPEGAKFSAASATPAGAAFKGVEDDAAAWVAGSVDAGAKVGPFTYKVSVTEAPIGPAHAWIHWTSPSDGTAASGNVSWQDAIEAGGPKRGCLSCHVVIDKTRGNYSLGFEAEERAKADYGVDHPSIAPDGTSIVPTVNSSVTTCLQCHKPSASDPQRGVGAPITLRDIVHPAHMFSTTFVEHYNGTCFTCHNVRGNGDFELLGDHVVTNEKGVPRSLEQGKGVIPGEVLPSEDSN
ncbi:MAG TPA: hypothetical protein VF960_02335 [Chloroflexota bacterium]